MRLLTTKRFERDLKRAKSRGKDLERLWRVVDRLLNERSLEALLQTPSIVRRLVWILGMPYRARLAADMDPG